MFPISLEFVVGAKKILIEYSLDASVTKSTYEVLEEGLIPCLLHLKRYLVYVKRHHVIQCHQLWMLLVRFSM